MPGMWSLLLSFWPMGSHRPSLQILQAVVLALRRPYWWKHHILDSCTWRDQSGIKLDIHPFRITIMPNLKPVWVRYWGKCVLGHFELHSETLTPKLLPPNWREEGRKEDLKSNERKKRFILRRSNITQISRTDLICCASSW